MTYYKATRPDGRDFTTCTIDYASALVSGEVIRHPAKRKVRNEAWTYLSVSVEPADCTGFFWPCRLFVVEPVGRVMSKLSVSKNKRAVSALRVIEERPAHEALGPNGEAVAAFIERCRTLTNEQATGLRDAARGAAWYAARDAAWDAAWYAAWEAARGAARDAAWYAAWYAAASDAAWSAVQDAALAVLVRDLITAEQYATLTKPFVDAELGEWVK